MQKIERQIKILKRSIERYDEVVKQKKSVIHIIIASIVVWLSAAILWIQKDKRFGLFSLLVAAGQATKLVFWMKSLNRTCDLRHELKKMLHDKEEYLYYLDIGDDYDLY